ncbi:hypothetical protein JFT66_13495 [Pseudomonas sp. MF6755]|uniref:hypothetical protein n=1 Tax=Pseudomonas sp. MF6755 TaxID=2797530 RepID=UPI0018E7CA57|nr:hypothetical protein [Pseudomonas sp. MF6755]MBJ2285170.1 hypothetical protein [Pseudomonas sp. MF6755]
MNTADQACLAPPGKACLQWGLVVVVDYSSQDSALAVGYCNRGSVLAVGYSSQDLALPVGYCNRGSVLAVGYSSQDSALPADCRIQGAWVADAQ